MFEFSCHQIQILHQDHECLVINKPAGLLSIPDGYHPDLPHIRSLLEPEMGRLWIVHRLDKETSGALLIARSVWAHKNLNAQFEQRSIQKNYHAIISGNPPWEEIQIDLPLLVNGDRYHRTVVAHQKGKSARTYIKVMERFGVYCLVQAAPETGYTHQIRAHLYAAGYPIAADQLYGSRLDSSFTPPTIIDRVSLHSYQISFTNPSSGNEQIITAPYPADFQSALSYLRQSSDYLTQNNPS